MQLIGDDHLQVKGWLQVSKCCLQVAPGEGQEEEEEEEGGAGVQSCRCKCRRVGDESATARAGMS